MQTRTIPADRWIEFFDVFSRDHVGWPATIEVLDRQSGPQKLAEELPLIGISFAQEGSRPSSLEIGVGDAPDRHLDHLIDLPLHIRELQEDNGDIDIEIEPAQGPITLLHVGKPS